MDFVIEGINEVHSGGAICDLFAGSASLAGAIGNQAAVHSNDIQSYSAVLAETYLNAYRYAGMPSAGDIVDEARTIVRTNAKQLRLNIDYDSVESLTHFNELEREQQALIHREFRRGWHLFVKNYSGTWWTAEQCLWIDAIRQIAENYKDAPCYSLIISCLMYAMAYTSQGTGHYAQYRDATTESSMNDILYYRRRSIETYFIKKFEAVKAELDTNPSFFRHTVTSLDFKDCLRQFSGGTVYADPPYCFVHYSRFYHAIETLTLYDYPEIQQRGGSFVKGRYREVRHQSPFCIKSQVPQAFADLFSGVRDSDSSLALSYSNTGMISIEEIHKLALRYFPKRQIELLLKNHKHMTLGRQFDRDRDVEECLFLVK